LEEQKNLVTLVAAIERTLEIQKDTVAVLFGTGILQAQIASLIRKSRTADRMRLLAFTTDLWSWMRSASVFVSVSWFEGNPNTVLEAMALKCPVVVSNIPEHREILDGSTALFCEPNSPIDVSERIIEALTQRDATMRRALAAQNRCIPWTIDHSARQYLKLYERICRTS
jgi:CDP-glycerol glycerophosphotransferase